MEERIFYVRIPLISVEYEVRCSSVILVKDVLNLLSKNMEKELGIDSSVILDAVVCLQEQNIPVSIVRAIRDTPIQNGDHLILV